MTSSFDTRTELNVGGTTYEMFSLPKLAEQLPEVARLPWSLRILLENLLRLEDGVAVTEADVRALAGWQATAEPSAEIAFTPARVLLQDFTGVPVVVDLAAMRDAMADMGGNAGKINPLQPVDLVIDHSVQVDEFRSKLALGKNIELEYERNSERYAFLRWGQKALRNFTAVPPGTGIVHQVNLEYLARVAFVNDSSGTGGMPQVYPDTLVGTDSHSTMVNGLGVLGWGVGGIEAEAAMLGQPVSMFDTPGHWLRAHRNAARRRDCHRSRIDGDRDAAQARRRRPLRRVLWRRHCQPVAARPRNDRQHEPRVWLDRCHLPG